MPLIKGRSKKAFNENVATEMDEGKPQKQALAIAFNTKRAASKRKMAKGGQANPKLEESKKMPEHDHDAECGHYDKGGMCKYSQGGMYAEGGEISNRYGAKPEQDNQSMSAVLKENYPRPSEDEYLSDKWSEGSAPRRKPDDERLPEDEYMAGHFADGGEVNSQSRKPPMDKLDSMRHRNTLRDIYHPKTSSSMSDRYGSRPEETTEPRVPSRKADDRRLPEDEYMSRNMSAGEESEGRRRYDRPSEYDYMGSYATHGGSDRGDFSETDYDQQNYKANSIAEEIMRRKEDPKKMADGGEVDLEANSEEDPNYYYDLNDDAAGAEQYDDGQISEQPSDSNETGDSREMDSENQHDHIDEIRRRMKTNRRGAR